MPLHLSSIRLQFSLLTMVIAVVFVGACMGLCLRLEPWVCVASLEGHKGAVFRAAYSFDGRRVVTAGRDKTARIWDAGNAQELVRLEGHTGALSFALFSANGGQVVTASEDATARLWSAGNGQELAVLETPHSQAVSAAFLPDDTWVLVNGVKGPLTVWSMKSKQLVVTIKGHERERLDGSGQLVLAPKSCRAAAFSPDGTRIVSAGADESVRVWNVGTGKQHIELFGDAREVVTLAFSLDGRQIVTGSRAGSVCLWSAESGKMVAVFKGHTNRVESVALSHNGMRILSVSFDGTVRVWDTATSQECAKFDKGEWGALSAAFSPDDRHIVMAKADGTALIWARRRPEYWWGIAWLPEFWVASASGVMLVFTAIRRCFVRRADLSP